MSVSVPYAMGCVSALLPLVKSAEGEEAPQAPGEAQAPMTPEQIAKQYADDQAEVKRMTEAAHTGNSTNTFKHMTAGEHVSNALSAASFVPIVGNAIAPVSGAFDASRAAMDGHWGEAGLYAGAGLAGVVGGGYAAKGVKLLGKGVQAARAVSKTVPAVAAAAKAVPAVAKVAPVAAAAAKAAPVAAKVAPAAAATAAKAAPAASHAAGAAQAAGKTTLPRLGQSVPGSTIANPTGKGLASRAWGGMKNMAGGAGRAIKGGLKGGGIKGFLANMAGQTALMFGINALQGGGGGGGGGGPGGGGWAGDTSTPQFRNVAPTPNFQSMRELL